MRARRVTICGILIGSVASFVVPERRPRLSSRARPGHQRRLPSQKMGAWRFVHSRLSRRKFRIVARRFSCWLCTGAPGTHCFHSACGRPVSGRPGRWMLRTCITAKLRQIPSLRPISETRISGEYIYLHGERRRSKRQISIHASMAILLDNRAQTGKSTKPTRVNDFPNRLHSCSGAYRSSLMRSNRAVLYGTETNP